MVVKRKIILSALLELGKEEPTTRDRWLTVDAWRKLIFIPYDHIYVTNFCISDFNRALNVLGSRPHSSMSLERMLGRNASGRRLEIQIQRR
jgi:hypothetical protein